MIANELMIGDWVKSRGKIEQVRSVYDGFICTDSFEDSHDYYFDPIPITPEILEKNGFVYSDIPFEQSWQQYGLSIYGTTGNYHINCGINVSMGVSNIHQLQHALRLCEIDKEIEL